MIKIYRVLGKKGRITIPFEIRQRIGFRYNDVLSFTQQDDGSVLVSREKICDNCNEFAEEYEENYTLEDFLDSLSEEEQRNALLHLCCGQKNRNTKSEVNLYGTEYKFQREQKQQSEKETAVYQGKD